MLPLVSVIIPTYQDPKVILRCSVESVLNQTYSNIEIIIIDDGSKIPFGGYTVTDDRIIFHNCPKNQGVAKARNIGINMSHGSYVAFLDTGDWWERDKIKKQLDLLQSSPNMVMVYASIISHDPFGRISRLKAYKKGHLFRDLLINQSILGSCSSVMIPKRVLDESGGFYVDHDIPEDQELWLRISKLGEIGYVDDYLVHLEIGLTSRSADPEKKMKPYQYFLMMYSNELRKENLESLAWANYYIAIADKYFSRGNFFRGMKYLFLSFNKKITRTGLIRLFFGTSSIFGIRAYSLVKHIYRNKGIQVKSF